MGKSTFSGPVSGAYAVIPIYAAGTGATTQIDCAPAIPTGMTFRCFGIIVYATTVSAATVLAGTASDADGYLTSTAFVAGDATFLPFDGVLGSTVDINSSADFLIATVVTTLTNASISLVGYFTAQTTLLDQEGV